VSELDRLLAEAAVLGGGKHPCAVLGHVWIFAGGSNCGCLDGSCSVPVHECSACGDCDYGENNEAVEIRASCREKEDA
jgi:hypothetical protein